MFHKWKKRLGVAALAALLVGGLIVIQSEAADSPVPRVALLELYTSEGCNSCPPADRWISDLPRGELVPGRLAVLAFHVDYWNYIGWKDRFSQAAFTNRQRKIALHNQSRTIYTPQLVLSGKDFRRWGSINSDVRRINSQPPGARLLLSAGRNDSALTLTIQANLINPASGNAELYVAIFENNLESNVRAGENQGRRLRHDYVVRKFIGPISMSAGKPMRWSQSVPIDAEWKLADLGVTAFVESPASGDILQAASTSIRNARISGDSSSAARRSVISERR